MLLYASLSTSGIAAGPPESSGAFVAGLVQKAFAVADSTLPAADRRHGLAGLLDTNFDMPRITAFVVGPFWQQADASERQAFAAVFRDHVTHSYSQLFAGYDSGSFRIVGVREESPSRKSVSTEIELAQRDAPNRPVQLDWLVAVDSDGQRVVDMAVGGYSMLVTKRAEFLSYLRRNDGGLAALTLQLKEQAVARD